MFTYRFGYLLFVFNSFKLDAMYNKRTHGAFQKKLANTLSFYFLENKRNQAIKKKTEKIKRGRNDALYYKY